MAWEELVIETDADFAPQLAELLDQAGASAVTFVDAQDDPIFEPPLDTTPLWARTVVKALFEQGAALRATLDRLQADHGEWIGQSRIERLPEQDWERAWMDDFQPLRFGRRLWIVPSWCEAPDPQAVNLDLDPGIAFGTGTHPTTALCLEWLDGHPPQGETVIDYGCGSGILAIAAALLGARHVVATDIDPQALEATRANAERNGVASRVEVVAPEQLPVMQADRVLANILAGPLAELAPRLIGLTRPGGTLVLAGLLDEQAETVAAAYHNHCRMAVGDRREGWSRLEGERIQ